MMIDFELEPISYKNTVYDNEVQHYVITANHNGKRQLLSLPNIYLFEKTRSSLQTSKRYATLIVKFYRFLSGRSRFKTIDPGYYHSHVTDKDLRHWQIYRQVDREARNSISPTSETIYNDALTILYFFKWLDEKRIATGVLIQKKIWIANFKRNHLLNYIEKKKKEVLDASAIMVLDRQRRQRKPITLISKMDMHSLLDSYPDKVYSSLFKFALATAMRPMELVQFPYMGTGKNRHILPYSEMDNAAKQFKYEVLGKGNKYREIIIRDYALALLDNEYIKNEYPIRKKLYQKKFGKKCPLSTLFLTKEGVPVTAKMIAEATNYAKRLAVSKDPEFRTANIFYHTRKWWPTLMMVQHHGPGILEKNAEVIDLALAEVITNQLGHEDFTTTYKHYLMLARHLVLANLGITHETIHEHTMNVYEAVEKYSF